MRSAAVLAVVLLSAAGRSFARSAGDTANCSLLPSKICWDNPVGKIASFSGVGADPQVCCSLCGQNSSCRAWNHGRYNPNNGTYTCDLYHNIGANKTSDDGCSGGFRAAATPRGDRPNIVFLVVESTDGRTWTPGYSNDLIPLPAIRELQSSGVSFHRHYANAPVRIQDELCLTSSERVLTRVLCERRCAVQVERHFGQAATLIRYRTSHL